MITINQNDKLKNELKKRIKEIINPYYISDPELYERYKKSIPPPEAFYYFPKGEEIIITNDKKPEKALRRIFLNVPYSDIEKRWIMEFKAEIQNNSEIKNINYAYITSKLASNNRISKRYYIILFSYYIISYSFYTILLKFIYFF